MLRCCDVFIGLTNKLPFFMIPVISSINTSLRSRKAIYEVSVRACDALA